MEGVPKMKVLASVMLLLLVLVIPVLPAFSQFGIAPPLEIERTLIITPVADSHTDDNRPALNFGASPDLVVAFNDRTGDLVITYLKFQVPDITLDSLVSASLNLNLKRKSRQGELQSGLKLL